MQFTKGQRATLAAAAAGLLAVAGVVQSQLDPLTVDPAVRPRGLEKATTTLGTSDEASGYTQALGNADMAFQFALGALSGFRQVIAGLLWVRSDSYFHSGNYDAILPLIRLITWMDPNWLDPYATGAWHLTYNFTDKDQRSDRRYLPAGVALLNEGIENNPELFDMYKEKGWLYYDKIKNYDLAAEAYRGGMEHKPDITQIGHALAHAYERGGLPDEAEKQWEFNVAAHKKALEDKNIAEENKYRSKQGFDNASKNLSLLRVRKKWRAEDAKEPVEADLHYKVVRVKPRVLEISGTFNLIGAKGFDVDKGIVVEGPVDGARMETRLQDAGYTMPKPSEFSFEVPKDLTLMQDALAMRGGKKVEKGGIYVAGGKNAVATPDPPADKAGVYVVGDEDGGQTLGVPVDKALAGGAALSPWGMRQLVTIAYPLDYNSTKPLYDEAEVPALMARLRGDAVKIADLTKKNYRVATGSLFTVAKFKREIDMSEDKGMYNFSKDRYELILTFNPRHAPDFVRDRIGWNGEGITDKNFLVTDTSGKVPVRLIRAVIKLSKEDIVGEGKKTLAEK